MQALNTAPGVCNIKHYQHHMNQNKPQQSREELEKRMKTSILLIDNKIELENRMKTLILLIDNEIATIEMITKLRRLKSQHWTPLRVRP